MPQHVREIVLRILNEKGKAPSRSKIMILGMTYKKDINDYRESPAIYLAELLLNDGIEFMYHDPHVSQLKISSKIFESVKLNDIVVKEADIVLIATDHSVVDYHWLVSKARTIIDTRNATKGVPDREKKVILI